MFEQIEKIGFIVLCAGISIIILRIYFSIFFEKADISIWNRFVWVLYFIWQVLIGGYISLPAYVNVIISVLIASIICISTYKGAVLQKTVFSVLIITIWVLIEFFVGYIFTLIGVNYEVPQHLGSVFSKVLTLILILILKKYFQNENIKNLPNVYNIVLLMIPIGSMYIVYNIFMLSVNVGNKKYVNSSLLSSVMILLLNIIVFKLYLSLSKEKELEKYNTVYEQQIELCNQHMQEKETVMMEYRNARHDLKNHFIVIMELIDSGNNAEAMSYLRRLVNIEPFGTNEISRTGNIIVDSLVNAKYSLSIKRKIDFEADIHIPMQLHFRGADICILLGNIIDNAIEASEKISDKRRYIKFYMRYDSGTLIIAVVNAYDGKLIRNREGKLISNKEDAKSHGIGLASVQRIVDKYNGQIIIETEDEMFRIKIILCDLIVTAK